MQQAVFVDPRAVTRARCCEALSCRPGGRRRTVGPSAISGHEAFSFAVSGRLEAGALAFESANSDLDVTAR